MLDTVSPSRQAAQAWERVKEGLHDRFGSTVFDGWFAEMRLELRHTEGTSVCLSVPKNFLAQQIAGDTYWPTLQALWDRAMGQKTKIRLTIRFQGRLNIFDPESVGRMERRQAFLARAAKKKPLHAAPRSQPEKIDKAGPPISPDHNAMVEYEGETIRQLDAWVKRLYAELGTLRLEFFPQLMALSHGVTAASIKSDRRYDWLVVPRHKGMYLARTLTGRPFPEIGRRFGGRDHSTVLYSVKKVGEWCQTDLTIDAELRSYEETIKRWRPAMRMNH